MHSKIKDFSNPRRMALDNLDSVSLQQKSKRDIQRGSWIRPKNEKERVDLGFKENWAGEFRLIQRAHIDMGLNIKTGPSALI